MLTRQYFQFKKYDSAKGSFIDAGYLLMPNEVKEFLHLVELLDYAKAFERLTGKPYDEVKEVKLVVEYMEKPLN